MVRKGCCVCSRCMQSFPAEKAVFYGSVLGNEGGGMFIPLTASRNRVRIASAPGYENIAEVISARKPERIGGELSRVFARVRAYNAEYSLEVNSDSRICPYCLKENQIAFLPERMGLNDSYFLVLCGTISSGKTNIAGASVASKTLKRLKHLLPTITFSAQTTRFEEGKATDKGTMSLIRPITLRQDIRNGREITVYFVDNAGETWGNKADERKTPFQNRFFQFVTRHGDGLLLLHDLRNLDSGNPSSPSFQNWGGDNVELFLDSTLEILVDSQKNGIPILSIMTKSDLLQNSLNGGILTSESGFPVLTPASILFRSTDRIAEHMVCANSFFRAKVESDNTIDSDSPCFVVSAGTEARNTEGHFVLDHSHALNVELPLYYLIKNWI